MCHMRRRIHVSYEEEDTEVFDWYPFAVDPRPDTAVVRQHHLPFWV